jgi:hypothetical protein
MFGPSLHSFSNVRKSLFLLGAAVLCWSLWLCRNNLVLKEKLFCSPLQVILLAARWLSSWDILQREDLQDLAVVGSQFLVRVATVSFPGYMGGDLVFGLIVPAWNFWVFFLFFYLAVCILQKPEVVPRTLYPLDVMYLVFL